MSNILKMENFIGVKEDNSNILGKFLYFSLSSILIERDRLLDICETMNLPIKPSNRVNFIDAFKSATADIYDRITVKTGDGLKIIKVYCRDNQKSGDQYSRELITETLGENSNRYVKLANITFDKETGMFDYSIERFDPKIDILKYCEEAKRLFELYKICAGSNQIESITDNFLDLMQSLKISIHGRCFFVPKKNIHMLTLFEDFIEEINKYNKRNSNLTINSMFVIDDAKQRDKMAQEFYNTSLKEIEMYTEKLENLISTNSKSSSVMDRWIVKVNNLVEKKKEYEDIFKRELNEIDEKYSDLKFLADELSLRDSLIKQFRTWNLLTSHSVIFKMKI